ncbi:MAG: ubiquitin-like domain-containing protein, partial [Candidatus Fonsibacter sp.]
MNDFTTKTNIINIKHAVEENDGIPVKFQRLIYQSKKLKDNHTFGYDKIDTHETIRLMGRLGGGGTRGRASASTKDAPVFLGIPQKLSSDPDVVTNALSLEHVSIERWLDGLPLPELEKLFNEVDTMTSTGNIDHITRINCQYVVEVKAISYTLLPRIPNFGVRKSELQRSDFRTPKFG